MAPISANEKPQKNFRSTTSASVRLDLGQLVEGVADVLQLVRAGDALGDRRVERRDLELPAALVRAAAAHVVDDQAAHRPRRVGHEARAIGKGDALAVPTCSVGLVHERRGAERQPPRAGEFAPGHPVQLAVKGRKERFGRRRVTVFGRLDQPRERSLIHGRSARSGDLSGSVDAAPVWRRVPSADIGHDVVAAARIWDVGGPEGARVAPVGVVCQRHADRRKAWRSQGKTYWSG